MTHRSCECEALKQPQTDPWDWFIFTYTSTIYMLANTVGKLYHSSHGGIFSGTSKFLSIDGWPSNQRPMPPDYPRLPSSVFEVSFSGGKGHCFA